MTRPTVSIVIPTFQAEPFLANLIDALTHQCYPIEEIILVDSGSTDETLKIADETRCIVESIDPKSFRHGRARNLGARKTHADLLVFLTQDAIPVDETFLEKLVQPLEEGCVAAYARQIPYPEANPIEVFARGYNYPAQSSVRTLNDESTMGIRTFFFSNSASAVIRAKFWMIGGFSENVLVNEDMLLCAQLLRAGLTVAYSSEAQVYHSHLYSLKKIFRRYFDIGVFFTQEAKGIMGYRAEGEGSRFVLQSLHSLITQRKWTWIPHLLAETVVKFSAFQIGKRYRWLSSELCASLSTQPSFWLSDYEKDKE